MRTPEEQEAYEGNLRWDPDTGVYNDCCNHRCGGYYCTRLPEHDGRHIAGLSRGSGLPNWDESGVLDEPKLSFPEQEEPYLEPGSIQYLPPEPSYGLTRARELQAQAEAQAEYWLSQRIQAESDREALRDLLEEARVREAELETALQEARRLTQREAKKFMEADGRANGLEAHVERLTTALATHLNRHGCPCRPRRIDGICGGHRALNESPAQSLEAVRAEERERCLDVLNSVSCAGVCCSCAEQAFEAIKKLE